MVNSQDDNLDFSPHGGHVSEDDSLDLLIGGSVGVNTDTRQVFHAPSPARSRAVSPLETNGQSQLPLIRGRYKVLKRLGGGGYGTVYLAEDLVLGIRVALKELQQTSTDPVQQQQMVNDFIREARLLARLSHENMPHVYDHFSLNDESYLVMEFIDGETLEEYVARVGTVIDAAVLDPDHPARGRVLPIRDVLDIGVTLCDVLDYLHTWRDPQLNIPQPIVFRDLKPANIMRARANGKLYLIDFGIARYFSIGKEKDTIALGSPGFAAPEQYGKSQTTPRSDIYSLGATLHMLLTGDDPSASVNPFKFAPLRPRIQHPGMDVVRLERLLSQMVNMDSEGRPVSASDVQRELQSIRHGHRTSFVPPVAVSRTSSTTAVKPSPPQSLVELVRFQHPSPISCLAWSSDGRQLATGGADGTTRIWDRSGVCLRSFPVSTTALRMLTWSPDSRFIATVSEREQCVQTWRSDSGLWEHRYGHPANTSVWVAAWSPNGEMLAAGDCKRSVAIWDTSSRELLTTISHPENASGISILKWSSDSSRIAFNGRTRYPFVGPGKEAISIWKVEKKEQELSSRQNALYDRYAGDIIQMSLSEDDAHLASIHRQECYSWDRRRIWWKYTLVVWNARKKRKSPLMEMRLPGVPRLIWWQRGELVVLDNDGWVRRYSTTGVLLAAQCLVPPHPEFVSCAPDRTALARIGKDDTQRVILDALPSV